MLSSLSDGTNKGIVFYVLILITVLVEALSISFLKDSIDNPDLMYIALVGYVLVALIFREALQLGRIGIANALWNCGTIIVVSIIGIVFYKDHYTTLEYVGLGLAIAATLCMIAGRS
jgi:small multidrug resistance pump